MIILDTNVISEVMRGPGCDPRVRAWIRRPPGGPVTTVINRAEILAGLAVLPDGRKRAALVQAAETAFGRVGAVLPLVPECASRYAGFVAVRREAGQPLHVMDGLIASIAAEAGAQVATRDIGDFDGLGLDLVNPWLS